MRCILESLTGSQALPSARRLFADPEQGTRARFLVLFMCHSERMNSCSISFRLVLGRSCVRKESHFLHEKVDCKREIGRGHRSRRR